MTCHTSTNLWVRNRTQAPTLLKGATYAPESPMSDPRTRLLYRLGQALRERDDDLARAPLPRRWVDLIAYLNERERAECQARQSPEQDPDRGKDRSFGT